MKTEQKLPMLYVKRKSYVCAISPIFSGITVANASHHLRTLHKQGLVKFRKEGKLAFYSLDDEHVKQIMLIALAHKSEVKTNV